MQWSIGSFFMSFQVDLLLQTGGLFGMTASRVITTAETWAWTSLQAGRWLVAEVSDRQVQGDE